MLFLPLLTKWGSQDMRKKQILVAEDHAITRENIALVLQDEGYDVLVATDGEEAVMLFTNFKPDLVLTDLSMPKLNGIGVLTHVKQVLPHLPVSMITATAILNDEQEARSLGVDDFLTKPLDFDDLLERITRLLNS
jgi:CheY-like chemotaxis protein